MKGCQLCDNFAVNPDKPKTGRRCMALPADFDECFDKFYDEMMEIRKTMTREEWQKVVRGLFKCRANRRVGG